MTDINSPSNDAEAYQASQNLHRLIVAVLVSGCVATLWLSPVSNPILLAAGVGICIMATLPILAWARHNRPWFPSFEIFLLTTINFYAVPLLSAHPDVAGYSNEVYLQSAGLVLGYLITANLVFNHVRGARSNASWLVTPLISSSLASRTSWGLLANTAYLLVSTLTDTISYEIAGTLRAVFYGIGTISIFVMSRRLGEGLLGNDAKVILLINLLLQSILLVSELYLIQAISLAALAGIGYVSASRKVPWVAIAICLPLFALLHNGKSDMRKKYWLNESPRPTLAQFPAYFQEWVEFGLNPSEDNRHEGNMTTRLLQRASLFQILCMTVDEVPRRQPFLNGESYIDVPALLVPRFIWPNKPSALMSNIRLAMYFGLTDENSAFKFSIAFGMLAEAYTNFGGMGVLAIGAMFGWFFKRMAVISVGRSQFSTIGLFMIMLTAWSFQAELVLATWVSSLFQAVVVGIGVPLSYRVIASGRL